MKLIYKLSIIMFGMAIFSVAALTLAGLFFTRYAVGEVMSEQQIRAANQAIDSIDQAIFQRQQQVAVIAADDTWRTMLTPKPPVKIDYTRHFAAQASLTGPWNALRFVDTNKKVLLSRDEREVGAVLNTTHLPDSQAIIDAALKGQVMVSDVVSDSTANRLTMIIAAPVMHDGQHKGTIVGELSWEVVLSILHLVEVSQVELFGKEVKIGDNYSTLVGGVPQHDTLGVKEILRQAGDAQGGSKITRAHTTDKDEAIITYVKERGYKDYKGHDWRLVMKTPTAVAFADADRLSIIMPLVLFLPIMLVIVGIVLWLLHRTFVLPITTLTDITQRIAHGDLSQQVTVSSSDELGKLGAAFNRMTNKLQEVYMNLETKVEEKTAELAQKVDEVEAEKAKDEAILASMGEGTIATDSEERILRINRVAASMLGVDARRVIGKKLSEIMQLKNTDGVAVELDDLPIGQALKTFKKSQAEAIYDRPDGTQAVIMFLANPIVLSGRVVGLIIVMRDITQEKEVDRMKTEFISLASHQLRTPLSAIHWFTEMLLAGDGGELNAEQREFAQNISQSTERMIALVNSLLNTSRIESGRIIITPRPTNLTELIQGVVEDFRVMLNEKHLKLALKIDPKVPIVNLDPRLVNQVFLNLLINSIKYTPEGGHISITVARKGNKIVTEFQDTGYGIPKAEQSKVFQKFFRGENIAAFDTDGNGLGLYLIKSIIESSGGKIWFKSKENKGTSFWFTLPVSGMQAKEGEVALDD